MANKTIVNSYDEIFAALSMKTGTKIEPHDLFEIGIEKIKRIDDTQIRNGWKTLLDDVCHPNPNAKVLVRSHGRNAKGSDILLEVLQSVFDREFTIDPSNNLGPNRILKIKIIRYPMFLKKGPTIPCYSPPHG